MSEFMSSLIDSSIVDLGYLDSLNNNVALEAANAPFLQGAMSSLGNMVDSVTTFFNGLKIGNFKPVTLDSRSILTHVNANGGWPGVRLQNISIPVGFKSTYIEFLNHTVKLLPEVEALEARIGKVQAKVASLVNEKDRLKAQSGIQNALKDLEGIKPAELDKYKAHFSDNRRSTARLCDVYARAADIESTYKLANEINARLAKVDFNGIQSKIDRLMELAVDLKKTVSEGDDQHVSGTVAKQISSYFYALASTVSMSSSMTHLMDEVNICLSKNVSEITKG